MRLREKLIPGVAGLLLLAGCGRGGGVPVAWDRYYSTTETYRIMRDWARPLGRAGQRGGGPSAPPHPLREGG
jgi:hypothetical protein